MAKMHDPRYDKVVKRLITTGRPQVLKSLLDTLNGVEIAQILLQLKLKHQLVVFELLAPEKASDVLSNLHDSSTVLSDLIGGLTHEQLSGIIGEMDDDDAADIVSILDDTQADALLETLPAKDRAEVHNLLQYDEESAGGLMTSYVVAIRKDQSVGQAIRSIRRYTQREGFEMFYTAYVVDEFQHLIGTVSVTELLLADRSVPIATIMNPDVVAVDIDLDQEEVARVAKEYDLVVVPVIDKHLRLAGRITIDDLVDVLYEEHHEDLGQFAGTGGEEVMETSIFRTTRERLPWLFLSMVGGFFAALVMNGFGKALSTMPETAYFIPLIAAFGGNVGIQSSSIMVRGLATGAIQTSDLLIRLWKELRVALVNGLICASLLGLMNWFITRNPTTALSASLALIAVVCIAASIGASVPILLKRLHIDPALATGPFITTANDILGISVYLGITFNLSYLVSF